MVAFGERSKSKKTPPILDVFEIEADHARLRIGEIELEQIDRTEIRAVAHGHQPAETQAPPLAALDDVGTETAALRNHADRAQFPGGPTGKVTPPRGE